jgi:transposase
MPFPVEPLPTDIEALRAIIAAQAAELAAAKAGLVTKTLEVEKLTAQLARLRRMQFDRSSEKITQAIEQLELALEELEAEAATDGLPDDPAALSPPPSTAKPKAGRRRLPAHLPRREVLHAPDSACPSCGGAMRKVGEDVTEVLDYTPARFAVIRHVRPALSCQCCETMAQAPMPSLPIKRGLPSAGLLAQVLIAKYCDHLPLYRQSVIYARDGVELERALLATRANSVCADGVRRSIASLRADWVGKAAALKATLAEAVGRHALAGSVLELPWKSGEPLALGYAAASKSHGLL